MPAILKKWVFKRSYVSTESIAYLYPKRLIIEHFDEEGKVDWTEKKSIASFLKARGVHTTPELDFTICQTICKTLEMPDGLSEILQKQWLFWQLFDMQRVEQVDFKLPQDTFLRFYPHGVGIGSCNGDSLNTTTDTWQRWAHLFFYGPLAPYSSIKQRQIWKDKIWGFLGCPDDLLPEDGYALFDYNKIKNKYWEKRDGITGEFVAIESGRVSIGGWDNPRDGGANVYSIEETWYHLEELIPATLKRIIPEFRKRLKKGLLE